MLEDDEGRNKSGTGLGLSICKQIIEQMGGTVSVKSKVGTGTEFIIDIKVQGKSQKVILCDEMKQVLIKHLENNQIEGESKAYSKFLEALPSKPLQTAQRQNKHRVMEVILIRTP